MFEILTASDSGIVPKPGVDGNFQSFYSMCNHSGQACQVSECAFESPDRFIDYRLTPKSIFKNLAGLDGPGGLIIAPVSETATFG